MTARHEIYNADEQKWETLPDIKTGEKITKVIDHTFCKKFHFEIESKSRVTKIYQYIPDSFTTSYNERINSKQKAATKKVLIRTLKIGEQFEYNIFSRTSPKSVGFRVLPVI